MPTAASAKPKAFRRAHLSVASLIAVTLGATAATLVTQTNKGQTLELTVSDVFRSFRSLPDESPPNESVPLTLILIDDRALARVGHWPWPWTHLADVTDSLSELGARLIVYDIEFPEPDRPHVVETVGPDGSRSETIVRTVPRLVASIRAAGNVLVPFSLYFRGRGSARWHGPDAVSPTRQVRTEDVVVVPPVLARHMLANPLQADANLPAVEGFQPMIEPIGAVCAGAGFASYPQPDPGGVVRRVPMLARGGGLFPHLMLETAGHWRFGPDYRVNLVGDRLVLSSADGRCFVGVPVDRSGQLELRWPSPRAALRGISVLRLLDLAEKRRRWESTAADLGAAAPEEGRAEAAKALADALDRAGGGGPDAPSPRQLADLRARLARIDERLAMVLAEYVGAPDRAPVAMRTRLSPEKARSHLAALQDYLDCAEDLRPQIADRLCLVGVVASAVAGLDLHTTPVGPNQPGVTTYPAAVRTLLSGVAFRRLDPWAEWIVAVLVAWAVGALTARLPTGWAIVVAVWSVAGIFIAARLAVEISAMLLPVAGPTLATLGAFAGVSGYRQLTEASSRRWITRVFEQYTSPEHVEEILRDPERLRLGGERRQITVLFSDIAGFTPLSERLEPERLVALLNHYLSAMTSVLLAERATLDKYEGDGILAFFGAPVPAPDHALRAVRAALAMQAALPRVNGELIAMGLLPEGTRLAMRVGCSTGPAIVGNFGSEQRFDYTAMGDTVNLGGRLEEANRWLGSRILVPQATQEACANAVLFRRFGPARIRGKAQPVLLYEPLALEPAPADLRAVAEAYNRAIDALAARDLDAAEDALRDLLAARPDDGAAQVLQARIEAVRAGHASHDEPWNLARPK